MYDNYDFLLFFKIYIYIKVIKVLIKIYIFKI